MVITILVDIFSPYLVNVNHAKVTHTLNKQLSLYIRLCIYTCICLVETYISDSLFIRYISALHD